jgi:hypothetical protein
MNGRTGQCRIEWIAAWGRQTYNAARTRNSDDSVRAATVLALSGIVCLRGTAIRASLGARARPWGNVHEIGGGARGDDVSGDGDV